MAVCASVAVTGEMNDMLSPISMAVLGMTYAMPGSAPSFSSQAESCPVTMTGDTQTTSWRA